MNYLLYLCTFLLLASCSDGQVADDLLTGKEVSVRISLQAVVDPMALNPSESHIKNVRVYAFDGNRLDKMIYTNLDVNDGATVTMSVAASPAKTFYVVANETAAVTPALAIADTPQAVEQAQYQITGYFAGNVAALPDTDNSYTLPMFGQATAVDATGNHPSTSPIDVPVTVSRSVARVDVYLRKATGNPQTLSIATTGRLRLEQSAESGYYAPFEVTDVHAGQREFATAAQVVLTDAFTPRPVYSFYVPEQTCLSSLTRLKLTLAGILKDATPTDYPPVLLGETHLAGADQLTKIERNKVYKLLCTMHSSEIETQVNAIDWEDEYVVDNNLFPLLEEANCYLMEKGGNTIEIPVSQANRAIPGSISDTDVLTAELLWSTVKGAKSGKVMAWDTPVAKVSLVGTGQTAYLKVTSGAESGNALVCVRKNGTIVWSWHIWVIQNDPAAAAVTVNGVVYLAFHLGAMVNTDSNQLGSVGLFYQWGRKDPFPLKPTNTLANGTPTVIAFDPSGAPFQITEAARQATIPETVQQPHTFFSKNNWLASGDLTLWGNTGAKTVYDPCPAGWRVASAGEMAVLGANIKYIRTNGWYLQKGYMANVGRIGPALKYTTGLAVFTSEATDVNNAKGPWLVPDQQNAIGRGYGCMVRCVKDMGVR